MKGLEEGIKGLNEEVKRLLLGLRRGCGVVNSKRIIIGIQDYGRGLIGG